MYEPQKIRDVLINILEKELEEEKITLVDLSVRGHGTKFKIILTIDKKGGITAEDTKRWAERLLSIIKVEGLDIKVDIEVTSPGLDRELRSEREFIWAKGKKVKLVTKDSEIKGHLLDFKENLFYIVLNKNLIKVPLEKVKKVKLCEMEDF
ncbi:MAG: hypothetical protein ABDH49_01345 [Candidatus Hydrothermales bacterium]